MNKSRFSAETLLYLANDTRYGLTIVKMEDEWEFVCELSNGKSRFSAETLLYLANDTRYGLTIVKMEHEWELVCELSNGVIFNNLE